MNPDTNKLDAAEKVDGHLVYKSGSKAGQRVPKGVPTFTENEVLELKHWLWRVTNCFGKKLVLESIGPVPPKPKRERTKNQERKRRKKLQGKRR
jgi:hypothetical protein